MWRWHSVWELIEICWTDLVGAHKCYDHGDEKESKGIYSPSHSCSMLMAMRSNEVVESGFAATGATGPRATAHGLMVRGDDLMLTSSRISSKKLSQGGFELPASRSS